MTIIEYLILAICGLILWLELRPTIEITENGSVVLFVWYNNERRSKILWIGNK